MVLMESRRGTTLTAAMFVIARLSTIRRFNLVLMLTENQSQFTRTTIFKHLFMKKIGGAYLKMNATMLVTGACRRCVFILGRESKYV